MRFSLAGEDAAGEAQRGIEAAFGTSDPDVAVVDPFGLVSFLAEGRVEVAAMSGEMTIYHAVEVLPNPTAHVALEAPAEEEVRVGDVIHFEAHTEDATGNRVRGPAVRFAVESRPDSFRPESLAAGAPAQILADGRFRRRAAGRLHGGRDERRPGWRAGACALSRAT